MLFTYDPILVIFSIIVSVIGAYTCFDLVIKIRSSGHAVDKKLLIGAAFAIGGSIWSMHFIAMLALNLPILIRYDLLMTLISGLVSVLMTALALLLVSTAPYSHKRTAIAGIIMGLGIASMHYAGMSAIRGNCELSYSPFWVITSVVIGMAASTASLWSAMRFLRVWRRLVAALVMGISISGVHYTGMAGTSFIRLDNALEFSQPIISPFSLGLITAIATFIILGYTLLTLIPESRKVDSRTKQTPPSSKEIDNKSGDALDLADTDSGEPVFQIQRLPVQKNQKTYFVNFSDIVSVSSDGHYTLVQTRNGENHFCNNSLSRVRKELDPQIFIRIHRCHIINLHHVEGFKRQHDKGLVFTSGAEQPLPVSRANIAKLIAVLGI